MNLTKNNQTKNEFYHEYIIQIMTKQNLRTIYTELHKEHLNFQIIYSKRVR